MSITRHWQPPPLDQGPFRGLGARAEPTAWHWLHMDLASQLMTFCHTNDKVSSVIAVCIDSLLTSHITITKPDETDTNAIQGKGDRLVVPTAADDAKRASRSRLFGAWGREVAMQEAAVGFAVVSSVANTNRYDQSGERQLPCVLNFDAIEIYHRKDVHSQHHWRVYERVNELEEPPRPRLPGPYDQLNGLRLMPRVLVLGADLPDSYGRFKGQVWSLVNSHEWSQFVNKTQLSLQADKKRAVPDRLIEHAPDEKKDPDREKAYSGELTDYIDQFAETTRRIAYLNQRPIEERCGEGELEKFQDQHGHDTVNHGQVAEANRALAAKRLVLLDPGQHFVQEHLPEAPQEWAVARQAFFEAVCLAFGVPMSMLSSGDASGKAKLNSETASPETAQIFRDKQTERKRRLEDYIGQMYEFMYAAEDVRSYIHAYYREKQKALEREMDMKKKHKKRKKMEEDPYQDDDETVWMEHLTRDDDQALNEQALEKVARVRVQVPNIQQTQDILQLLETGLLNYQAACQSLSRRLGIDMTCFNPQQAHTEGQQLVYGTQPKPEPKEPAKKKAKKAK